MKVLIWNKSFISANIGGPIGYIKNLRDYISDHPDNEIFFYTDVVKQEVKNNDGYAKSFNGRVKSLFKKYKMDWVNDLIYFIRVLISYYFKKVSLSNEDINIINGFDFVHVHTFYEYNQSFINNDKIKAKVILTTHTPEPTFDEKTPLFLKPFFKGCSFIRNFFIRKEMEAYKKADFLMFPVPSAIEVYTNSSKILKDGFTKIKDKMFFVPTAIPSISNTNLNVNYSFPAKDDELNVCYIGRHTVVKGYDSLKKMAKKILESNKSVRFIIGGEQHPLKGLNHKRWKELGWVNTPALLNAVDVFILPNKETYFDLIVLEVLRCGTPIIMTRTGGNKWFESNIKNEGIFFYDYNDTNELNNNIERILNLKRNGKLDDLRKNNRMFCEEKLSMKTYVSSYKHYLNSIK